MNLAPREKRTLLIGAAIVAVAGLYLGVSRLKSVVAGAGAEGDQKKQMFSDARTRIVRYETVGNELKKLTDTLRVEIPADAPTDQMKKLVERFESIAGRSGVQIRNLTQLKSQARATAARGPARTEMKLDLTCQGFVGLVRFIDSLEQASVPIVVDQISITTSAGRSGGASSSSSRDFRGSSGRGGPGRREIQVALKIYTYLFPERVQQ